jgi:hypothetical protein
MKERQKVTRRRDRNLFVHDLSSARAKGPTFSARWMSTTIVPTYASRWKVEHFGGLIGERSRRFLFSILGRIGRLCFRGENACSSIVAYDVLMCSIQCVEQSKRMNVDVSRPNASKIRKGCIDQETASPYSLRID